MHRPSLKLALVVLSTFALPSLPNHSAFAASVAPVTAKQLIAGYEVSDIHWSSDGRRLAAVVTEPVSGDMQRQHIWIYDSVTGDFRQLTLVGDHDTQPSWSPDGKYLAFLSERDTQPAQLYVLPMTGGEALSLTDGKAAVKRFAWAPTGKTIAFLSADSPTDAEKQQKDAKKQAKDDAYIVGADDTPVRLRIIDLASHAVRQVTKGVWRISDFAWVAGEKSLIISGTDIYAPELLNDRLYIVDAQTAAMTELPHPDGPFQSLRVSLDGKTLAYIGSDNGGPGPQDLYVQSITDGTPQNLTGKTLDRGITDYAWQPDGTILALTVNGFGDRLVRVDGKGSIKPIKSADARVIQAFSKSEHALAYVSGSATALAELWLSDKHGDRQISHLNKGYPTTLVTPELIRYPVEGGMEIEAALYRPAGASAGRPLPLIVLVHGGPRARWNYALNERAQLLAAHGFAVLTPNIRGSIGYGIAFIRSNRGDWGGGDFRDVMAGVDHLIARGIADPNLLGIGGWSYGGYMSAWAITQTNRFKAAVIGAPMTDVASEYGTEEPGLNAADTWYLGTPYENLDRFMRVSPITHVRHARTPALIMQGDMDTVDPIGQSQQFYRGLRRYNVETEMVVYPREGHGIKEEKHHIDVLNRYVAWFEKYVK